MRSLSVVIPTHNRVELLLPLILSIIASARQADCAAEIYVCDDRSTDNTEDEVKLLALTSPLPIRYVRSPGVGANAARNSGVSACNSEYVWFVDDDELVPLDVFGRLGSLIDEHPEMDGFGGPVRDLGGGRVRVCESCSFASVGVDIPAGEVSHLLGGNMVLRADLFRTVGCFSEGVVGWGEESEWFGRATGARFIYDHSLWLWHTKRTMGYVAMYRQACFQGRGMCALRTALSVSGRPNGGAVVRYLWHALRKQCFRGLFLAVREIAHGRTFVMNELSRSWYRRWRQGDR